MMKQLLTTTPSSTRWDWVLAKSKMLSANVPFQEWPGRLIHLDIPERWPHSSHKCPTMDSSLPEWITRSRTHVEQTRLWKWCGKEVMTSDNLPISSREC